MGTTNQLQLWDQVLGMTSASAADGSCRTDAHCQQIDDALTAIYSLPPAAGTTWMNMVSKQQLPKQLGEACCQLLDTPWAHSVYLTVRSWLVLLGAASAAGFVVDVEDMASSRLCKSSIALSLGQQLDKSGLLSRLPALITSIAQQLQAAAGVTVAPAAQHSAGRHASSAGRAAAASAQAVPAPANAGTTSQHSVDPRQIAVTATCLRIVVAKASLLWNEADYYSRVAPALIQPLSHLAVAALQQLSAALQDQVVSGSASSRMEQHFGLLESARGAAHSSMSICSMVNHVNSATMAQVAAGSAGANYFLQCACLEVAFLALRKYLPGTVQYGSSSSSSSSGGSEYGSSTTQQGLDESAQQVMLWGPCCKAAANVPAACQDMLRLLQSSTEAALWVAATAPEDEATMDAYIAQGLLSEACTTRMRQQQHQQSVSALDLSLLWQLPQLALLWAEGLPSDTPAQAAAFVRASCSSAGVATRAMYVAIAQQHLARGYSLPAPGHPVDQAGTRAPLPASYAAQALPLQCQMLSRLLQLQRSMLPTLTSNHSSSSSRSLVDGTPSINFLRQLQDASSMREDLWGALGGSACNLHLLAQHVILPQHTSLTGSASLAAAAADTAGQLCACFEDLLRSQSSAAAAEGLRTDPQLLAVLRGVPSLLNGEVPGWEAGPLVDPISRICPTELNGPQALQLLGLLRSMLKAAANSSLQQYLQPSAQHRSSQYLYVKGVLGAATQVLNQLCWSDSDMQGTCAEGANLTASGLGSGVSAGADQQQQDSAVLPWLLLLGRYVLMWGGKLRGLQGEEYAAAAAAFWGQCRAHVALTVASGMLNQLSQSLLDHPESWADSSSSSSGSGSGSAAIQQGPGGGREDVSCVDSSSAQLGSEGGRECVEHEQRAEAMLPWLTLLGGCVLMWAAKLRGLHNAKYTTASADFTGQCQAYVGSAFELLGRFWQALSSCCAPGCSTAHGSLEDLARQLPPLAQALDAAGRAAASHGVSRQEASARFAGLAAQLTAVGDLLAAVPSPQACNNPFCANTAGAAEAEIVSSGSTRCSGCRMARYCSKVCQRKHWGWQHKPVCKALTAAAAGTASAEAVP